MYCEFLDRVFVNSRFVFRTCLFVILSKQFFRPATAGTEGAKSNTVKLQFSELVGRYSSKMPLFLELSAIFGNLYLFFSQNVNIQKAGKTVIRYFWSFTVYPKN